MEKNNYLISLREDDAEELRKIKDRGERDAYASTAFHVGMSAMRTVRGEIDSYAVKEQLTSALGQLQNILVEHTHTLETHLNQAYQSYVGRQEISASTIETGLSKLLADYRSGLLTGVDTSIRNSASPLLKMLDPNARDSAIGAMESTLKKALDGMTERIKTEVLSQFSRDSSGSAMSRLEGLLGDAVKKIQGQFSLDDPLSALSRLSADLNNQVAELANHQNTFEAEIRQALATMTARKEAEAASTTHGRVFEEAVGEALGKVVRKHGHAMDACGHTTGLLRGSKVGDFIIRLGNDCAAPGALIAVEAKAAAGYGTLKIVEESETARKNRGAQVTIFVIDPQYAIAEWPAVDRLGETIVVKWSQDDPSDVNLFAAFSIACALVVKAARQGQASAVDWTKMEKAVLEVQKRTDQLEEIAGWTSTIASNAAKIQDRLRISREALTTQATLLMEQINALKSEAA